MFKKIIKSIIYYTFPKSLGREILYRNKIGKKSNLGNPIDFGEKINWLIVNKYGEFEGKLADKYLAKEYVLNKNIDKLEVPKSIEIYNNSSEIDLNKLPDKFVLKCNNGSGKVFICTSKSDFDIEGVKKELNRCLKENYAIQNLEYHYSYIKPCIIAEEYLEDSVNMVPIDYKFYCFNGKVSSILVCSERDKKLRLDDFDINWNKLDYTYEKYKSKKIIGMPKQLNDMIEIAEKLSDGIPFVRVDLYNIKDKIYFGEYTFSPAAGFLTYYKQDALNILGKKLDLCKYD